MQLEEFIFSEPEGQNFKCVIRNTARKSTESLAFFKSVLSTVLARYKFAIN